jgi:hypothetical protein
MKRYGAISIFIMFKFDEEDVPKQKASTMYIMLCNTPAALGKSWPLVRLTRDRIEPALMRVHFP